MIDQPEQLLIDFGFRQTRVWIMSNDARIEFGDGDLEMTIESQTRLSIRANLETYDVHTLPLT
jgi:PP-loop superfamily ATP-utilizing enzyme